MKGSDLELLRVGERHKTDHDVFHLTGAFYSPFGPTVRGGRPRSWARAPVEREQDAGVSELLVELPHRRGVLGRRAVGVPLVGDVGLHEEDEAGHVCSGGRCYPYDDRPLPK